MYSTVQSCTCSPDGFCIAPDTIAYAKVSGADSIAWRTQLHLTPGNVHGFPPQGPGLISQRAKIDLHKSIVVAKKIMCDVTMVILKICLAINLIALWNQPMVCCGFFTCYNLYGGDALWGDHRSWLPFQIKIIFLSTTGLFKRCRSYCYTSRVIVIIPGKLLR